MSKKNNQGVGQSILNYIGNHPFGVLGCLALLFSFFIFEDLWEKWINKLWVDPVASQIGKFTGSVVLAYVIIISLYYSYHFQKEEQINTYRLKIIGLFILTYCLCFFSGKWDYVLIYGKSEIFAWSNLLVLVPIIWEILIILHIVKPAENGDASLEIENTFDVKDSYGRVPICKATYQTLSSCFYKEGSFAVGIVGAWGSGKTTFKNNLKKQYCDNKIVKSIIDFEPWKNDSTDSIIRSFFSLLREELNIYIPNISSVINEYIDLLVDDESIKGPLKLFGKWIQYAKGESQNLYEQIRDKLEGSQHKIVVFIDDIDRLNADEIKEILRIIRNTANFPFVQFIVTYDKNYICEALNGIANPELYLEKFFNVEINLPKTKERIICEESLLRFKPTVKAIWGLESDDSIRDVVFRRMSDNNGIIETDIILPQILHTIRDVIRFHNAFCLTAEAYKYQGIEKEIEFQDLFYVELLRYRFGEIYSILSSQPLLLLKVEGNKYILKEKFEDIIKNYKEVVKFILKYLFSATKNNSINYIRNYDKYFMYKLDDKILTESEVLKLIELDENLLSEAENLFKSKYPSEFENQISDILNQISINSSEKNYKKLYSFLIRLFQTDNRALKKNVLKAVISHLKDLECIDCTHFKAMLKLCNDVKFEDNDGEISFDGNDFLRKILFIDNISTILNYKVSKNGEEAHIVREFLNDSRHSVWKSSAIGTIIRETAKGIRLQDKLLIGYSELGNIQVSYFKTYPDKLSVDGFSLFHNCTTPEQANIYGANPEAIKIMKEAIYSDPDSYIDYLNNISYTLDDSSVIQEMFLIFKKEEIPSFFEKCTPSEKLNSIKRILDIKE